MYFSASMTIDPASLNHIRRKPSKGFRRLAEILTANLLSQKEVHQTFTAISVLQEINMVLRSMGILDAVKFSKDDQVIYDDSQSSSSDDMSEVIDLLSRETNTQSTAFQHLSLLLEHQLESLVVIIEVRVMRVHDPSIFPIQISINGLDPQMQATGGTASLEQRLDEVFASQQSYDAYTESKHGEFQQFVDQLEQAFRSRMKLKELHSRVHANVIRPGLTAAAQQNRGLTGSDQADSLDQDAANRSAQSPMMQRYQGGGMNDSLMYMWLWSSMMHSNNVHCHNTTIVDENGHAAFSVGQEGFLAGQSDTLNPEAPFEAPDCPIVPVESIGGESVDNADFGLFESSSFAAEGSSWFDSFAFGDSSMGADFGDWGGDGGGASCGGGCGGGCGS